LNRSIFIKTKKAQLIYAVIPLLFLLFSNPAQSQTFQQNVQHFVDSVYAANPSAVGFMVHVEAPDQKISWEYAVGRSDRNSPRKLTPNQPLLIASNTKPYVAATIMKLVEQGKLRLDQPLEKLLTARTAKQLKDAGYEMNIITIKRLLSHTSGIRDYVDPEYFKFISEHKKFEWTRDDQIARAASAGKPLATPGDTFRYADINYLLLTEIIERVTKKPFYDAMRDLLDYKALHLDATWFTKLESVSYRSFPRAHQYWDEFHWEVNDLDPSWDLYGGGGMISTMKEMALFFQYLFEGKVIKDKNVLEIMTQDVPPNLQINYCLGIRKITVAGDTAYNHGGGLGTDVVYIPKLNASISVAALEAGHRPVALAVRDEIVRQLEKMKSEP
jgi:D-alanyl-D-alanine carboxypeptidase